MKSDNPEKTSENSANTNQISRKVAHDLRTPLNTILGLSQMLQLKEQDEDKLNYLKAINQAGDSLLKLINQLAGRTPEASETHSEQLSESPGIGLSPLSISAIPSDSRQEMYEAIVIGDFSLLRTLIDQLPPESEKVAKILTELAEQYDQANLLELFDKEK